MARVNPAVARSAGAYPTDREEVGSQLSSTVEMEAGETCKYYGTQPLRSPRRRRTTRSIRPAACTGSSCSQTLIACQFSATSARSVSASRFWLPAIFALHHDRLDLGSVPCSGQPCQKHPSTKTATRALENTRSARRRRRAGSGATSTRYRSPRCQSSRRSVSSGWVSRRRWFSILFRIADDEALGRAAFAVVTTTRPYIAAKR
jgi:hypothetical protein